MLILNYNNFSGSLPAAIGKLCKLTVLYLESNNLNGELPPALDGSGNSSCGPLASLRELDVSANRIPGHLPRWLEDLKDLMYLALESNLFTGGLPPGVMKLPRLMHVYAAANRLTGEISEAHLAGARDLVTFELDYNRDIKVNLRPDWVPPFQLERLGLSGCRVGPRFPAWIKSQENLQELYLSDAGISDAVPPWFWGMSPSLIALNLSSNLITGSISEKVTAWKSLAYLDLSNNRFSGGIPSGMAAMPIENLDLSNNDLSGKVPLAAVFNMTALHGDPLLCGPPTDVNCTGDAEDRRRDALGGSSFYLGMATGAAGGILLALVVVAYLGRFLKRNKVNGDMTSLQFDDPTKDGGRMNRV